MPTPRERAKFSNTLKNILRLKENEPKWQADVGKRRETQVFNVLSKMKKDKEIVNFLPTGELSPTDIFDGIDCYVVFVDKEYRAVPISITGPDFVEEHRKRHPEVPIVSVKLSTPDYVIRNRILEIINSPS